MGYDQNQLLKALTEAEAYNGPSLIIGYAPCEMHGVKGGMQNCQFEMKKAVEAGYWQTFRYNPTLESNKLTIDSKEPNASYVDFIKSETRYARLAQSNPERAAMLFAKAEANAKIVEVFQGILGLDKNSKPAEVRKAIRRNQALVFDIIEESVQTLLVTGWGNDPFMMKYVDQRNLALGDKN